MGHEFDKMTLEQALNILDPILNQLDFEEKSRAWRTVRETIQDNVFFDGTGIVTETLEGDYRVGFDEGYIEGFEEGRTEGYSNGWANALNYVNLNKEEFNVISHQEYQLLQTIKNFYENRK